MDAKPPHDATQPAVTLTAPRAGNHPGVVKILFLAANPQQTVPLQLDEEARAIDQALQQARYRDQFVMEPHGAVRATDLQELLLRHQPDIVHFTGHGSASNELILVAESGEPQPVTAAALRNLFGLLKDNIRCVVLNACFSIAQAQAIAEQIDVVIGMSQAIGDGAAVKFSAAFYGALAYGRNVQNAFELGCAQVELANLSDTDTPKLFAAKPESRQLVFVSHAPAKQPGISRDLRNRQALLQLVKEFWIDGVLHPSLAQSGWVELGLATQAAAVQPGLWQMLQQQPDEQTRPLPDGTKISTLFTEMQQSLLILGEPGSGKTTTLLQLTQDLLAQAEEDPGAPIPVIFNLASWAERCQPLAEWLVEELRTKYRIPTKIAQPWVANDDLLLLLDGLDQVKEMVQGACVAAINHFCDHHKIGLAVCCRTAVYQTIEPQLALYGAVILQPLTADQVQQYLAAKSPAARRFAQVVRQDPVWQQLTQTPLLLSLISQAVADPTLALTDDQVQSPEEQRRLIFDRYIAQMFARRSGDQRYTPQQTLKWLGWLAYKMQQQGQVEFLIEQLQPTWLSTRQDRLLYAAATRLLIGGAFLLVCGAAGLFVALVNPRVSLIQGMAAGGLISLFLLFPFLLASGLIRRLKLGLTIAITTGLTTALGMAIFSALGNARGGVVIGLLVGVPAALLGATLGANDRITPLERLTWSWRKALWGSLWGVGIGVLVGLIGADPGDGPVIGLLVSAAVLPLLGLTRASAIPLTQHPNQGIQQSLRSALLAGGLTLLACFGAGLIWGIFYGPRITAGFALGLLLGLPLSLITGLGCGGIAALQHFVLRLLLAWRDQLPWDCGELLNFAADHILLRKVGGSYHFIHALLRDHFAALPPERVIKE